ncbi:MAG: hypothetical protein ACXW1F_07085 [Halobacteriota archaeon]
MAKATTLHDTLLALDPSGIEDFPAELGAFSVESLCVSFNFTRQQHLDALAGAVPAIITGQELPENVKTVIHETTHLFHTLTTPLGLFIHRLRRLQGRLVIEAIRQIVRGGIQPRFPLIKMRGRVPGNAAERFETYLQIWYAIELYVLILLGEIDFWQQHLTKNPLVKTLNLTQIFISVQNYLALHINEIQRFGSLSNQLLETTPAFTGYEHENFDALAQERFWGNILVTDMASGGGANTLGVIESAGTVSEYYGSQALDLEVWKQSISAKPSVRSGPQSWLLWAFHIRAKTLPDFMHAYLGICELALFAPLLPEYRPLRKDEINLRELLPYTRWFTLLGAAQNIDPPTSPLDYSRYVDTLSEAAGWPTITQIAQLAVQGGNTVPLDPVEQVYRKAQHMRVEQPAIFLNYPWFVFPATREHLAKRIDFEFPVIKYTDKTLFTKDKEKLNLLNIFYLCRLATRTLLLKDTVDLKLPYDPLDEERVQYARAIQEMLSAATGAKMPKVSIL